MYENADPVLDRILELVLKCPKDLQPKCFEILLDGYVKQEVGGASPMPTPGADLSRAQKSSDLGATPPGVESQVPAAVVPRFRNAAKRLDVPLPKLEGLFDFTVDPFGLHAVSVPGENNAEKTRNVALLVAARAYLANGTWSADWQEVKAQCVDQNCYDSVNHSAVLKKGAPKLFKPVEAGKPIELATGGIQEAEKLIKRLAVGNESK